MSDPSGSVTVKLILITVPISPVVGVILMSLTTGKPPELKPAGVAVGTSVGVGVGAGTGVGVGVGVGTAVGVGTGVGVAGGV